MRGRERVENYRRGIGAGFLLDDFDARAFRPNFELLDGGSAKSVGGAQHHARAILLQAVRELADRRGFSRAVHADDEKHARGPSSGSGPGAPVNAAPEFPRTRSGFSQFAASIPVSKRCRVRNFVLVHLFAQRGEHFLGGAHADIGAQQRRFKLLQQLGINGPIARQQMLDARGQLRARLADRLLEPVEKGSARFAEE